MYRLIYRLLILFIFSLIITGCDDDENVASSVTDTEYYTWKGSDKGEWVVDANGDQIRFEVNTGYMHFGNTYYVNARVKKDTSEFFLDGEVIGTIKLVKSVEGGTIAALVDTDNTYLDIRGIESDLFVDRTHFPAEIVSTSSIASQSVPMTTASVRESDSMVDIHSLASSTESEKDSQVSAFSLPMPASNAFTEPSSEEYKTGILLQAQ